MGVREEEDTDVTDAFLGDPDDACAPRQGRSLGGWCREVVVPGARIIQNHEIWRMNYICTTITRLNAKSTI